MPHAPRRACQSPGCPNVVEPGQMYCKDHLGKHSKVRASASERGYTYRWQKASKAYLRAHPLCIVCQKEGRYQKATVVDHIRPHRGDQELFWDRSNWQPLCKPCHDKKTGLEDSTPEYHY